MTAMYYFMQAMYCFMQAMYCFIPYKNVTRSQSEKNQVEAGPSGARPHAGRTGGKSRRHTPDHRPHRKRRVQSHLVSMHRHRQGAQQNPKRPILGGIQT